MPRYFFDLDDGTGRIRDDVGLDLHGVDQAATETFELLMHVVRDRMPEGRHLLTVRVRDPRGNVVYVGQMTVDGSRHDR